MVCGKCKREIPAGQEVTGPLGWGFYHKECNEAAAMSLLEAVFEKRPKPEIDDEPEEPPTHDADGPIDYSGPRTTMSCCGVEKKFDRSDDEPCWNCGAI